MKYTEVVEFLRENPGYIKKGKKYLSKKLKANLNDVESAKKQIKLGFKPIIQYNPKDVAFKKDKPKKFKRLFWDIETSYNIVSSWNIGYKINIDHNNIIKERAIICICYKWAEESKVHSLQWNKGDDKKLLEDFIKIMNTADECIGHNSDRFDERWLRTRAAFHGIPMMPSYQTIDTLKLSRSGFRFNSNRLDYLGKFFGVGGKMDTGGLKLWQNIVVDNCQKSLNTMIKYCKRDVEILEKVYNKLNPYTKSKTHVGVTLEQNTCTCPNCASSNTVGRGYRILASGVKKKILQCKDCGKYYIVSLKAWENRNKIKK